MNAPPYVPFVGGRTDQEIVQVQYADAPFVRLPWESLHKGLGGYGKPRPLLWADPGFDVFGNVENGVNGDWLKELKKITGVSALFTPEGRAQARKSGGLAAIGKQALDAVSSFSPRYVSVPQFPIVRGWDTLSANAALATAAGVWRAETKFQGVMILPVILTKFEQYALKAPRTRILSHLRRCLGLSGATAVWAVDSDLQDQSGAGNLQAERIPSLVRLHSELQEHLSEIAMVIAGPYWCAQLNLWCRGLATHMAVGLGSAYQYHLSGGIRMGAKDRLALAPLRRWAVASARLGHWVQDVESRLAAQDPHKAAFTALRKLVMPLSKGVSRRQIARFYHDWIMELAGAPSAGRSVLLFQQLTAAYALGRTLPALPDENGPARRPERVAEQHMVNCL